MRKKRLISILFIVVLGAVMSAAAVDVPYLTGRITDNANLMNADTKRTLTQFLKAHEDRTTNQIAVLTAPSLEGESVEDYATAVFDAWKLGQKGKDNGILIVVAPQERRMRIEVGYGLEGVMPDGLAGDVIRDVMAPKFKTGDYNGGIDAGARAVVQILEGANAEEIAGTQAAPKGKESFFGSIEEESNLSWKEKILLGAFIFGIIGLFTVLGVLTPGVGWFLYFFLIPFWAMFPIVIVGKTGALYLFITYIVVYPVAKILISRTAWHEKAAKDLRTKGKATIGGFVLTSGGSGGSWSSGSSGGGGFSGGGGSSGGGGASGSW